MDEPLRNELTPEKIHQRQVFFRIYLPVIIASLILITVITLLALSLKAVPTLSQTWAHISVIMLIVPFILLFVVLMTVLSLAVFGMYKANKFLPGKLRRLRDLTTKVNTNSQHLISRTASPVIHTRVFFSSVEGLFNSLQSMLTRARRK